MTDAPTETYVFRILGWIGPEFLSVRHLYQSEDYPTLHACRLAASQFQDGKPPAFRGRDEPRRFYVVRAEGGQRVLSELCVA